LQRPHDHPASPAGVPAVLSSGSTELVISLLKKIGIRTVNAAPRQCERDVVHLLDAVLEHWPVGLCQDVSAYFDAVVRPDAEDMLSKRRMVDLADGQAIGEGVDALRLTVRDDVGGIQERAMSQPAHCATSVVRLDHPLPEHRLVEALPDNPFGIPPFNFAR